MRRDNRWRHGPVHPVVPPLPTDLRGASGTLFQAFTLDPEIGREVVLVLLEEPAWTRWLASQQPLSLSTICGLARTSAGVVAYIVWTFERRGRHLADYEHYLNPFDWGTIGLLRSLGDQTHLKLIIVESENGEVVGFTEFPNTYRFHAFADGIADLTATQPVADFAETQAALKREFTLEDLKTGGR